MLRELALLAAGLAGVLPWASASAMPIASGPPEIRFDHFSTDAGLSQSNVTALAQDALGFLWIGTERGLNRFDGSSFLQLRHNPDDPTSLGDDRIHWLMVDRSGFLWIATNAGIDRFDPNRAIFEHHRHDPHDPASLATDHVKALAEDAEGRIWVATFGGGLDLFDPATSRILAHHRHLPEDPDSLADDDLWCVVVDRDGLVWVGTDGAGLDRIDPRTGTIDHFRHDPEDPTSLGDDIVLALFEDRDGTLWVGTAEGGLNRFDRASNSFRRYRHEPDNPHSLSDDRIWSLTQDTDGMLWVGTSFAGINRLDPATGRARTFRHDIHIPWSLADDRVYALLEDRSGVLWVGTASGGLNRAIPVPFRTLTAEPGPEELADNNIRCILESSEGIVWIGSHRGGLDRWDRTTGSVENLSHRADDPTSLSQDRVWSIAEDDRGRLWVGTPRGLDRLDPESRRFRRFRPLPEATAAAANDVNVVLRNRRDRLWLGTWGHGVMRFDPATGRLDRIRHPDTMDGAHVYHLAEGQDGTIWVGTREGLSSIDPETLEVRSWRHDPDDPQSLPDAPISSVLEDHTGTLWIGTWGEWIRILPRDERPRPRPVFRRLDDADGLLDNTIAGLIEDRDGDVWVSTSDGLFRFDRRRGVFVSFGEREGLTNRRFNPKAIARCQDGALLFGGFYGLVVYQPPPPRPPAPLPEVVITAIRSNRDRSERDPATPFTTRVELDHQARSVTFEFTALDFHEPARQRFSHRLIGFDPDWVEVGASRTASYTNLPPGRYRFEVRAGLGDGPWTPSSRGVEVDVAAPPWRSWWALSLYVILGASMVIGVHRARVASIQRRAAQLERLVSERTVELSTTNRQLTEANRFKSEFLAIAAHDLRSPLQGIRGYAEIIAERVEDSELKNRLARIVDATERMVGLLGQLIELSRVDSGAMTLQPSRIDLRQIVEGAVRTAQPAAARKQQRLEVEHGDPCPVTADADSLQRVVDNLVSNAIKFSPPGKRVWLSTRSENGHSILQVRDEGPGFTADDLEHAFERFQRLSARPTAGEPSTGLGLAICHELVALHGGTIRIVSDPGEGATMRVELPSDARAAATPNPHSDVTERE